MSKILIVLIVLFIPSQAFAVMERNTVSILELWEQSDIVVIGKVLTVDSTLVSLLVKDNFRISLISSDTLHLHIPSRVNWFSYENGVYNDLAANENPFVEDEEYLVFADASNQIRCMGYSGDGFFLLQTLSLHTMTQTVTLVIRPQIGVLTYDDLERLDYGLAPDTSFSFHSNLQFPLLNDSISFEIIVNNSAVARSSGIYRPREYTTQSDIKSINELECYVHMGLGQRSSTSLYNSNESNIFITVLSPSGVWIRLRGRIESFKDGIYNIRIYSKSNFLVEHQQ